MAAVMKLLLSVCICMLARSTVAQNQVSPLTMTLREACRGFRLNSVCNSDVIEDVREFAENLENPKTPGFDGDVVEHLLDLARGPRPLLCYTDKTGQQPMPITSACDAMKLVCTPQDVSTVNLRFCSATQVSQNLNELCPRFLSEVADNSMMCDRDVIEELRDHADNIENPKTPGFDESLIDYFFDLARHPRQTMCYTNGRGVKTPIKSGCEAMELVCNYSNMGVTFCSEIQDPTTAPATGTAGPTVPATTVPASPITA